MAAVGYSPGPLKRLYDRAPVPVQHALTSAYGLRLAYRAHGGAYERHFARLRESQWWPRERLERFQVEWLRRFLRHAERHSPYWRGLFRERGLEPGALRSVADLRALPPLEKETVRRRADDMIALTAPDGPQPVAMHTSGTTGKALEILIARDCWEREHAFRWLQRSWAGVRRGERTATFAGHPVVPVGQTEPPYWRYNAAARQLIFSSQHIGPRTAPAYTDRLRRFRPVLLHGYPSALALVARRLEQEAAGAVRPRAIVTHSETLLDTQRALLERVFDCGIFDWYGTSEHAGNIVECERGSLHVKLEHSVIEFVRPDGTPAGPGEEAELLCTTFANPAMPLVRYRTGDRAVLAEGECACGRSGPLVERVLGRVDDYIATPDGRRVGRLDHVFKETLNVYEAQLVQCSIDALDVRVVPRPGFGDDDRAAILEELRARLGDGIALRIDTVPEIPRGPNGKFRFAVSKVSGAGAMAAGRG